MFTVRDEQIESLRIASLHSFETEMIAHLAVFSPSSFTDIKEDVIRKVVELGIRQAKKYGFNLRGPVRLYLEMMTLLGSYFDTDPQYPWAAELLNQSEGHQMQRADSLYYGLCDYNKHVCGKNDEHALSALNSFASFVREPLAIPGSHFADSLQQQMALRYPQKSNYMGIDAQKRLLNESVAAARRYLMATDRGLALSAVLMSAFGHGCFEDPLCPWIRASINDDRVVRPDARVEHLGKNALIWFDHLIASYKNTEYGTE